MAVVFSFLRRRHFSRKRAIRALYPKPYSSSGVSPPPDNETCQPRAEQQPGGGLGDGGGERRNNARIDQQIYAVPARARDIAVGAETGESGEVTVIAKKEIDGVRGTHGGSGGLGDPVIRLNRTVAVVIASRMRSR